MRWMLNNEQRTSNINSIYFARIDSNACKISKIEFIIKVYCFINEWMILSFVKLLLGLAFGIYYFVFHVWYDRCRYFECLKCICNYSLAFKMKPRSPHSIRPISKIVRWLFSRVHQMNRFFFSESSLHHFNMKNFIIQSTDKFTLYSMIHDPFGFLWLLIKFNDSYHVSLMFIVRLDVGVANEPLPNFRFINAFNRSMAVGGWWPSIL